MGYCTKFTLESVEDVVTGEDKMREYQKQTSEGLLASINFLRWIDPDYGDSIKWYEYNDDMKKLSKHFPQWSFILRGMGENEGDIWFRKYINGKCWYAMGMITPAGIFEPDDG